jgi:CubicO group peptidase (beta-lactamase class C family)
MNTARGLVLGLLVTGLLGCQDGGNGGTESEVTRLLRPIREARGVPALAALVADSDGLLGEGVAGVRKWGDPTLATTTDKWHLGSDTKAMTATLVGLLVEDGLLTWEETLGQALPDLAEGMDPASAAVTLRQLLTMQGGFRDDDPAYQSLPDPPNFEALTVREQRAVLAAQLLALPPAAAPGSGMNYSNFSYIVVGAVLEAATDQPWEQLLQTRLFAPLGMVGCGFGAPASPGLVDQPWPHQRLFGVLAPVDNGPGADNPPFLGPAGTVHCPLEAWARFGALHLGIGPNANLLAPETLAELHLPAPGEDPYAMGWGVLDLGSTLLFTHDGSNTMNYARILLFTEPKLLVLIACNEGSEDHAVPAVDEAMKALVEEYGSEALKALLE